MSVLPVMLHGADVRALVVGGGPVAARRALALLDVGATVRVVAPRVTEALEREAAGNARLRLETRRFRPRDLAGATLVVAATDERGVNAQVAARARERGVPVNVADRPEEGTFSMAAVHRSGPLVVAVSAGGVPSAAARIRDALAGRLDARLGDAVDRLRALRARLLGDGDVEAWRRAVAELTGPDFVPCVEAGDFVERVRRWR